MSHLSGYSQLPSSVRCNWGVGDQKVLKRVLNHRARNSVREFSILEYGNIYEVMLHPTQGGLEALFCPRAVNVLPQNRLFHLV